jgi:4-coumarate--CoA ligase
VRPLFRCLLALSVGKRRNLTVSKPSSVTMTVVKSQWQTEVVPQNLITYIFHSPEEDDDFHSSNVPIIVSAEDPDRKAHTFNEYKRLVLRFASGLREIGLKRGDRVLLFSGNSIYFPLIALGTIAAGGVFTSVLNHFQAKNVAFHLKDTGARYFLASGDFLSIALAAADQTRFPETDIFVFDDSLERVEQTPSIRHWSTILNTPHSPFIPWEPLESEPEARSTIAVINYTSGYGRTLSTALLKRLLATSFSKLCRHCKHSSRFKGN